MCEVTKKAIIALVAADEMATDAERESVAAALAGEFRPLTICEAAERLGVTRPTVYAMIRAAKLVRVGKRVSGRSIAEFFKPETKRVKA